MLDDIQFMHTFIKCKNLEKEPVGGLDMQWLVYLVCNWTDIGHMFWHQGSNLLLNSIHFVY